eukprot:c33257_g1_i1 orf=80-502(+)
MNEVIDEETEADFSIERSDARLQQSENPLSKLGVGASAFETRSIADFGIHVGEKISENPIYSCTQEEKNKGSKNDIQCGRLKVDPSDTNVAIVPRSFRRSTSDILLKGWPSFQLVKDHKTFWQTTALAFQTLGVIYGDLG